MSKSVLFVNFSKETFIGEWDKQKEAFKPSASKRLPEWLANHYAKHLVNRELLKAGKENDTSPKVPQDNAVFMELFSKAVIDEGAEDKDDLALDVELMNTQDEATSEIDEESEKPVKPVVAKKEEKSKKPKEESTDESEDGFAK